MPLRYCTHADTISFKIAIIYTLRSILHTLTTTTAVKAEFSAYHKPDFFIAVVKQGRERTGGNVI